MNPLCSLSSGKRGSVSFSPLCSPFFPFFPFSFPWFPRLCCRHLFGTWLWRGHTLNIILHNNLMALLIISGIEPNYLSHVSSCFFLLGDWGTGFWDPSSSSLSLSSYLSFFGLSLATCPVDSVSWAEASGTCFSTEEETLHCCKNCLVLCI